MSATSICAVRGSVMSARAALHRRDPEQFRPGFRPDIEGLRAVAVLLVVGNHIDLPGFHAGFIGVDMFFIISGFLIARTLISEAGTTGRIDLGDFWVGRIRRLIPLAATVIVATLAVSLLVLNPMRWFDLTGPALSGVFFLANEHFADASSDYFAASTRESPFLHLWSLSVEEQFYVAFPIVLVVTLRLRRNKNSLELPVIGIAALSIGSAVAAWRVGMTAPTDAYFSLWTRAWELGTGVLLAFGWSRVSAWPTQIRKAAAALGATMIFLGLIRIEVAAGFPAWGAVYPVWGTALLIGARPTSSVLAARPVMVLGRLSYGWYLWHWPVLVLGREVLGRAVPSDVFLALLALALAALTFRLVENPIRFSSMGRPASIALGLALSGLSVIAIHGVDLRRSAYFDGERALVAAARDDYFGIEVACIGVEASRLLRECSTGVSSGRAPVLLFGDSHMTHWRPAVESAAESIGVPTVRSILGDCMPFGSGTVGATHACNVRREGFEELLTTLRPAGLVISQASVYGGFKSQRDLGLTRTDAWRRAMYEVANAARELHIPLAVILDTPRYPENPLECMAAKTNWDVCALDRAQVESFHAEVNEAIRGALAAAGHGFVFDPIPLLCPEERCRLVVDGVAVPIDTHHISATFAASVATTFDPVIRRLLQPDVS